MKLSQDRWFRGVFIIGGVITLGSATAIGFSSIGKLGVCFEPECFANFLTYYAFPFKAATATAAALGLVAMLHRSKQTSEQIVLSTKQIQTTINQNQYLNYFSHLKGFKEQLASIELTRLKHVPSHNQYRLIFPKNTPDNFKVVGTINDLSLAIHKAVKYCELNNKKLLGIEPESFEVALIEVRTNEEALKFIEYHNKTLDRVHRLAIYMGFRQLIKKESIFESDHVPDSVKEHFKLPKLIYYNILLTELQLIVHNYKELSLVNDHGALIDNIDSFDDIMRMLAVSNVVLSRWAKTLEQSKESDKHLGLLTNY